MAIKKCLKLRFYKITAVFAAAVINIIIITDIIRIVQKHAHGRTGVRRLTA
jgi:hypothetical protein